MADLISSSSPILSVRLNPSERALLDSAAASARTSVSDFVRRRAVEAAELEWVCRPQVSIPAADWERFEAWAREPGRSVDALRRLTAARPAWEP